MIIVQLCCLGDNGAGYTFWNLIRDFLATPGKEQIDCQHPKPILLDTANMTYPYEWEPSIVPVQILRIGQLFILAVPGEFTTMSGRRLRNSVKKVGILYCLLYWLYNAYA